MKKINARFEKIEKIGESDIYRKYHKEFDKLLNMKEVIKNKKEFDSIYVENLEFEKEIKRFKSSIVFCVGYTGIGKTTSIRHCFDLGTSDEIKINTVENELIFPTFVDNCYLNKKNEFNLLGRIATACEKLEEENSYLHDILSTDCGKEEFYNFMRKHAASSALEYINPVDAMDMEKKQLIRTKLAGAYKKNPLDFMASQLKFYISKNYDKYKQLIIILDNIEKLPENTQKDIIGQYIYLQKFMQKTDYPENNEYQVNLLISIQPHMYKMLINSRFLEISGVSDPAIIKKYVNFNYIFRKRFDYYIKSNQCEEEKKTDDYTNLMNMVDHLDKKYENTILLLCLFDVRKALAFYSMIFANRFWIQDNKIVKENINIDPLEYKFEDTCVIRAIACNENSVFWGDGNTIIPNIFYTTQEEDLSVFCLLVLKYFYRKNENVENGINTVELEIVKKEWENIFQNEDIINKLLKSLGFLFEKKVLRKLIKTFEDVEPLETEELLKGKSKLYISSRGKELYEMLRRDSAYLEMLRENVWRDFKNREDYSEYTSNELMKESKYILVFKDLLEYINYLREEEEDILLIVKRKKKNREYKKAFGKILTAQILLEGVKNTLETLNLMPNIQKEFTKLQEKINETKKQINIIDENL